MTWNTPKSSYTVRVNKINNIPQEIFDALAKSKNPICCISARPDFDGYCSALAIYYVIKQEYGVELKLTYYNPISDVFRQTINQFADCNLIETNVSPRTIDFSQYDLLLYTDCSDKGFIADPTIADFVIPPHLVSVNIDHHQAYNNYFATYNYVDYVSSTCTILYELFKTLGIKVNSQVAALLLLGVLDDSLLFQVDSVRPRDLVLTSELIEHLPGKSLFDFVHDLTYNQTKTEIYFAKITFEHMVLDLSNQVVYSYILQDDFSKYGIDLDDEPSVSPIELIRKVQGTKYAFLLKQQKTDLRAFSLSMRSRDEDFDVSVIARAFEGGGHKMAAGGMVYNADSPEEAIEKVIAKANVIYPSLSQTNLWSRDTFACFLGSMQLLVIRRSPRCNQHRVVF